MLDKVMNEIIMRMVVVWLGLFFTVVAVFSPGLALKSMKTALNKQEDL
jgi:hypothetical protein